MSDTVTFTSAELEALMVKALRAANTSEANAKAVARALLQAEIDGRKGHGFSRIPSYTAQSRSGKVDGHAVPEARETRPGVLTVDAGHGFFYPAFDLVLERLPAMARANGLAAAGINRSHHAGVLGWHVERLADAGLVSLLFANTPKAMPPWGGNRSVFGTNPIAFGAPRRDGFPIVIDMSLTTVVRGNIMRALQLGEAIPEGWATDKDGNPTTDPAKAIDGMLMAVGGAKGAALALMVEILAAPLAGAALATEASSFFTADGGPPRVGQVVIAFDPDAFAGRDSFLARVEEVLAGIESQKGARVPGGRIPPLRAAAAQHGLAVPKTLVDEVRQIIAAAV